MKKVLSMACAFLFIISFVVSGIKFQVKATTEDTFEYTLVSGQNCEIVNNTGVDIKVATNCQYNSSFKYDYIQYDATGKINKLDNDQYMDMTIISGDKRRISVASGNEVKLYIPYEYKNNLKVVDTPAFYKYDLLAGENCEISNTTANSLAVLTNCAYNSSFKYDYIQYDATGKINKLDNDQYMDMTIISGDKRRISVASGDTVKLYIPYEYINNLKVVDTPAFYKYDLLAGENCEISNTTANSLAVLTNCAYNSSSKYDYIQYDATGKINKLDNDQYRDMTIISGDKSRISVASGDALRLYIPYEYKDNFKVVTTPVFYKYTLPNGGNCEIANTTANSLPVLNDCSSSNELDYIEYDASGKISALEQNDSRSISIRSGGKRRISVASGNAVKLNIPYEYKDNFKVVTTPVFYKYTLPNGGNCEIANTTANSLPVLNDCSSSNELDYIEYDASGKISALEQNDSRSISIKSGGKRKISVASGNAVKLNIPYEYKDNFKVVTTPVFYKYTLPNGENCEIANTTANSLPVLNDCSIFNELRYDYIEYDASGKISTLEQNDSRSISIKSGGKRRISVASGNAVKFNIPYEYKDSVKTVNTPVFYKLDVNKGSNYIIKNSNNYAQITNSAVSGTSFNATQYYSNGGVKSSKTNSTSNIYMQSKEYIYLSIANGESIKFNIPYEFISASTKTREDLDGNETVDILDLAIVANRYNNDVKEDNFETKYDMNFDGIVDIYDIVSINKKIS